MPNKLSQFWQELKRRNVVRVITVYAGAAFVILELVDILSPSLGLPQWTLNLVLILLIVGFFITIIVSWIYDIQPEGGLVKTEPIHQVNEEETPKSSNSWKIASYISFAVILGLIILNIIPRTKGSATGEVLDKSIAVLPFHNDSPDRENDYFISGTMESILNNLAKIGDLRVISRSSVERYRDSTVYIPDAARFLNVSYILEGSMQKYGEHIRMTLQLIDRNDRHVWAEQYDREIKTPEENLSLQSEIAELVAGALQVAITPEEQQLMEKIPTTNATAYEFYQKGMDEYWKYSSVDNNPEVLRSAETMLRYALEYDSTYAPAYAGLARVYYDLLSRGESYFSEDYMDTVMVLADKALSFDSQLSDAHSIKGDYYDMIGKGEQALLSYERALELNPNDWSAYNGMGSFYQNDDLLKAIDNFSLAISRYHGPSLWRLFGRLGYSYQAAGIMEKGDSCYLEASILSGDQTIYVNGSFNGYWMSGDYEKGLEFAEKAYSEDSMEEKYDLGFALLYSYTGQFEKALPHWEGFVEELEATGRIRINEMHRIGYTYWMNGDKERGGYYLNMQKEYCENEIKLGRWRVKQLFTYYDLAGVYAFQGERNRAYENLRIFNQRDKMPQWVASLIKRDPLFDSIRDEPEFQQIVNDVEAKYQIEHERVRKWLEENEIL